VTTVPATLAAQAARAYQLVDTRAHVGRAGATETPENFGAMLERAVQDAVQTGHTADSQASLAIAGGGNLTEVTIALAKAELALQSAVAVRDRIVAAYQDIMHIQI
jgi:flagellar hook-basal body complex protein FliE